MLQILFFLLLNKFYTIYEAFWTKCLMKINYLAIIHIGTMNCDYVLTYENLQGGNRVYLPIIFKDIKCWEKCEYLEKVLESVNASLIFLLQCITPHYKILHVREKWVGILTGAVYSIQFTTIKIIPEYTDRDSGDSQRTLRSQVLHYSAQLIHLSVY